MLESMERPPFLEYRIEFDVAKAPKAFLEER
jgi:hypothetical protein